MENLQDIIDGIRADFTSKSEVRDKTLKLSRELISHCARAIQATHRADRETALQRLQQAGDIAAEMIATASPFPDVYFAGYTQDGLKEYAEANLIRALILGETLPTPQELKVENAAYINGLAEAVGELRRHTLDVLRRGDVVQAEKMLATMDTVYSNLMRVDFPSAITSNLRRNTDMVRGVTERTRGDVTTAVRQEAMKQALAHFEKDIGV